MAWSKCGSCNGTSFEIKEASPTGSRYKFMFVQCATCGVPIGAQDYLNTGAQIQILEQKVVQLEQQLRRVEMTVTNIDQNLARLANRR